MLGMVKHGAKLGYTEPLRSAGRTSGVPNLPMDEDSLHPFWATVADRLARGRARVAETAETVVLSPICTVPKSTGGHRKINHLS
jgi:hypothetical protein